MQNNNSDKTSRVKSLAFLYFFSDHIYYNLIQCNILGVNPDAGNFVQAKKKNGFWNKAKHLGKRKDLYKALLSNCSDSQSKNK